MSSLQPPPPPLSPQTSSASCSASKLPPFDISRLVTQAILPQSTSTYEEIRLVPNLSTTNNINNNNNNNYMESPSESCTVDSHTTSNEEMIIVEETTTTNVDNTIVATIAANESVNGPCSVLVGDVAVVDDDDELLFSGSPSAASEEQQQEDLLLSENTGMASDSSSTPNAQSNNNLYSSSLSVSTSPAASATGVLNTTSSSNNNTPRLSPRTLSAVDTELESISTMTTVKTTSTTKKVVKRHSSLSAQTMDKAMDQAVNASQQTSSSNSTPQKQSSSQQPPEEEYTTLQSSTPKKKQKKKGTPGSSSKQILGNFFKSLKGYLSRKSKKSVNQSQTSSSLNDMTNGAQNSSFNQSSSSQPTTTQHQGTANDAVYFNPSLIVTQAPNPKNTSTHSISTTTQSETVDDAEIIRTTTTTTTTLRRKSVNDEAASSSDNNLEKIEIETEEELQTTTTTVTTKKKRKKQLPQSGINAELAQQQQQVSYETKKSSHKHIPSFTTTNASTGLIKPLLAPQRSHVQGKKTLVLDLDETLVHSVFVHTDQADFVMPIEMDGRVYQCYVLKRPGVDEFLREMGKYFEIVIFTASLSLYANPLLDILDKHGVVEGRLFREHCTKVGDTYIKDLSKLGRDLDQTIIVDNSPSCYALHPQNALAASTWYDDPNDRELYLLADCLVRLEREKYVYDGLRAWKELISSNLSAVNVAATSCGGSAMTVSSTSHHHKVIKKRL
ncbi:hypothetical protein FDP41_001510 [Naegleria fowleri]|uniref:FCP1 homology domain-containing protein n=1 Tax=Naegleria fowleri TaxID=5763 RepID=A0A6A5BPY4_NAEFO|nr:uncharacterized protein FDP41_001510 [Naegleria fowleri]KAF0979167.1 hypothetical protein FDP41_001510 [Naegleria fowleri]